MITGRDSWKKGAAIFLMMLVAVLDVIFCTQYRIVGIINGLLVAGALGVAAYRLYQRWKDKD